MAAISWRCPNNKADCNENVKKAWARFEGLTEKQKKDPKSKFLYDSRDGTGTRSYLGGMCCKECAESAAAFLNERRERYLQGLGGAFVNPAPAADPGPGPALVSFSASASAPAPVPAPALSPVFFGGSDVSSTEYKGIIAIVDSYSPGKNCQDCIRFDLPKVLAGVSNFDFIAQEAVRCAESRLLRDPIPRLILDEAVAIAAYSFDLGLSSMNDGHDNLFFVLNNVLRERNPAKMTHLKGYLAYLLRGLAKLPPFEGEVYRGVPAADLHFAQDKKKYGQGNDVHWSAFSSTTTSIQKAKEFAQGPGGVIFRLQVLSGRKIKDYSFFQTEEEVLLSPNMRCIVSRACHEESDGYFYVDLAEKRGEGYVF